MLQSPTWDALPDCTFSKPSHDHLPEALKDLLKCCEEASCSDDLVLCPVPEFFLLEWIEALQCFYCKVHQILVSGAHLWTHIGKKHKGNWPKITRSAVLAGFLGHIQKCYPRIVSQLTMELKATLCDIGTLEEPLSSAPVDQRYKCPVQDCTTWSMINKGKGAANAEHIRHIRTHFLSGDSYMSASSVEPQWTQRLTFGEAKKEGYSVVFIVPHDSVSDTSTFPIPTSTVAAGPAESWPIELGWDNELQWIGDILGMSKKVTIAKLQDLVELPSLDRASRAKCESSKQVEKGLCILNRLSLRYFSDVVGWIAEKHGSFQLLFGPDGYV